MSLRLVVDKEFRAVRRSRLLWGIVGLGVGFVFVLLGVLELTAPDSGSADEVLELFAGLGGQLVFPIVALVAGYMAVVGERRTGSIRILHGLPHDRREILVGKYLGRASVIVAAVVASFLAIGLFGLVLLESVSWGDVALVALATALAAAAFVAIAVGLSAASASRARAMAGAIGAYFLFAIVWEPIVAGVHYLREGSLVGLEAPAWYFFLLRLSPIFAYADLVSAILDRRVQRLFGWPVEEIPPDGAAREGAMLLSNRVAGDLPFYLEGWFAAVVLVGWIAVALGVGYAAFRSADLA